MSHQHHSDPSARRHRKHHLRTPTELLGHKDKLLREASHRRLLLALLLLVAIGGGFAALLELDSWAEWVVLGGICMTVIGVIIALSPTRPGTKQ